MTTAKEFDCVEMKRRCQESVAKRYEGLSAAERHRKIREDLEHGTDEMSRFWQEGLATRRERKSA